jgi:DNA-binding PucR family transcriptional regulator
MSSFDAAQRRLEHALRRIEAAASRGARGAGAAGSSARAGAPAEPDAERDALSLTVNQLREECGRLQEALDAAQRENAALRRANDEVARRLDGTIDELQQLMEA